MKKDIPITIIGLGQVGKAFLRVLSKQGYRVVSAFNKSSIDSSFQKEFPKTEFKKGIPDDSHTEGSFLIVTVSDDAIAEVSHTIASNLTETENSFAIHCSGTHTSDSLSPLKSRGFKTASFHPIKAITPNTDSFKDCWFDMEGDEELLKMLEDLAETLGANSFRVEPEAKPLLHASAVVASNYLVVLADLFTKISSMGNIPEETAIKALAPLMENTLENIQEFGVEGSLTGPISRGDVSTIKEHIEKLGREGEVLSLYKIFGREAVKIAEQRNGESGALDQIKELLK
ncbi:Rossmann-like and DUF2520 domain-containing protein [Gracilimonas sp.]|uniref:Rossmann-like and DUF2520 domain-containing protein n=1 Tax=Gracilimonas sp. TaxID=1974203 RepID=UPI00287103D5|nr:DUF2520 domain-containing protein [Gracilimonas sp.]